MKYIFLTIFIICHFSVRAQDSLLYTEIEDVVISATRLQSPLLKTTISSHQLSFTSAPAAQEFSIVEKLRRIPGVLATNQYNSAQDMRLSIRGFGARSAFGIRGIRLFMDGIPMTTPDGQGQVDNIPVGGIKNVEVLNGSSSALYGNASGGVVSFTTFTETEGDRTKLRVGYGSYDNLIVAAEAKHSYNKWQIDNQLSYNKSTGYRSHSRSENTIFNGRISRSFKNGHEIKLIVNYLNSPEGEDPGGITLDEVDEDRTAARDRNLLFDAGEELSQLTTGVRYDVDINSVFQLKLNSYFIRRDFANRLPFENGGQVDLLRNYGGGGAQLVFNKELKDVKVDAILGLEIAYQDDDRKRYNNEEGLRGLLTLDQSENFLNQAAFLTTNFEYQRLIVNAGLRFDYNAISLTDRYLTDGVQDGSIILPSFSPNFSIAYRIGNNQYIRSAFSYGFETPTLSELGNNPDGSSGFNDELLPTQSYNYELGYRARWSRKVNTSLTLFYIKSQDELLPFEVAAFPGRTFYKNVGRTNRKGIESMLTLNPIDPFRLTIAYTYSHFLFEEFDGLDGNRLPGIPRHNVNVNLDYSWKKWRLHLDYYHYSSQFVDNENSTMIPAFDIANMSLSRKLGKSLPYIGVRNIFNEEYYDNVRINAFGNRYYEAAPLRNFYIGVKFDL